MIKHLYLDFETASPLDLRVVGLDRYAKHPLTRPLMLAWAVGDGVVNIWQPHLEPLPKKLMKLLCDPFVKKVAWSATFEKFIFEHRLGIDIPWDEWIDPMVSARHLSLPGSLEDCGRVMGLMDDEAKIKDGDRLIDFFCSPYRLGGEVTLFGIAPPEYHDWETHPADWKLFLEYCIRDVETERIILNMMGSTPLPQREQDLWVLDQIINECGIPTNRSFVENAYSMALRNKESLVNSLIEKTGLKNPNARPQMLPWLQDHGYAYNSLDKKLVTQAIASGSLPKDCSEVLIIRQDASKTSYTKLEKLKEILSEDNRLRGQFMFLGASRSGRWSGMGVQVHNLPRPIKWVEKNLDKAIRFVDENDYEGLTQALSKEKQPPTIIGVASSLIRSCFQAPPGKKLSVCDLNAIENRVLGWVTGCHAILEVFTTKAKSGRPKCPYLSFACQMYGCDYDELEVLYYEKDDPDAKEKRQVAKPAVLGAGYGLGSGVQRQCGHCDCILRFKDEHCPKCGDAPIVYTAIMTEKRGDMIPTGLVGYAQNMGVKLTPEQAYFAWKAFRKYEEVIQGWKDLENAAIEVLKNGGKVTVGPVEFDRKKRANGRFILRIKLPSGRYLHYINAMLQTEEKVSENGKTYKQVKIMYDGIGHGVGMIKSGWGAVYTYGGKLMENIVQAISRDLLADAMMMAHKMGAEIVLHVHDEIVTMADADDPFAFGLKDLKYCMSTTPFWAPGLPLLAAGFEGTYYRK